MLTPKHLDELRNSCIDPDVAALNFHSIDGSEIYEYLCYSSKLERLNAGRLAQKWLDRYSHCEAGGWWCSGLNPVDSWQPMSWGCFKPNSPKEDYQKPGKFIKYEHPAKSETRAFFLRVPLLVWERIAKRYSLALPENIVVDSSGEALGFWAWVLDNPKVPVIIVEGAKKAGCLLTHSFIAIALPGVFNGYRSKDAQGNKIDPYLIPDLKVIAQKKRPTYICFDHDTKQQTVRNVNIATSQLGRLLKDVGGNVKVISLPGPEKGVDDFIQARGIDAFCQIYNSAMPLSVWQTSLFRQLSYEPNVVVSTKYLGDVGVPDDAKLVAFKAPKGSGKTEAIAALCEHAYKKEQPVIVLTYREQLGRELARRFKLPYKTELRKTPEKTLYGFALCVDSCRPESEARFTGDSWGDALVVIDECESVVWHTLNSATCTKTRLPILHELEALFLRALSSESKGRVVLADADLSDLTIDFVKGIAGQTDLKPYVIRSDYKPLCGDVFSYETPTDLYNSLVGAIEGKAQTLEEIIEEEEAKENLEESVGGKHIIFTTGQKVTSKWGTQNIEKDLKSRFPQKRILRIDRDTVADPNHPAYACIDALNEVLPQWDIVIASPVIESGVSIDLHDHFAGVWEFASGVIPTDNVRQVLARVRDISVPRHVWMPEKGLPTSFIGNGATFPTALRNGELKKSKANFSFLLEAGVTVDADGSVQNNAIALSTWLKMASRINAGFWNYRETILEDLRAEGYNTSGGSGASAEGVGDSSKDLSELMADSRDELKEDEAKSVVESHPPKSEIEYEKLKSQKTKTPEQRRSLVNYEAQQRYLAPPTADVILKDWDGWYLHLRMHYYLTVGNQYLSDRDGRRFSDIAQDGRSWLPDTNRVLLSNKVKALKVLGIDKLFDPGVDWTQDSPEIQEITEKALACANDIKLFLGVRVTPKNQPMAVVQEILDQALGFRLEEPPSGEPQVVEKGINSDGKRQRARIYKFVCPDDRKEVFDRWLLRDAEATEQKVETVSSSEQMAQQTPKDLYIGFAVPCFADPYFADPTSDSLKTFQEKTEESPPLSKGSGLGWVAGQRVKAWFGIGRCWCEGLIQSVEVNSSNCFKAVIGLANGATQYIWDESELVVL